MEHFNISMDVEPDLHTNKYSSIKKLPLFLDILNKYKIKATFFITCDCLEQNPSLFKEIKEKGHEIALHGYRHRRFDELSTDQKKEEIENSIKCFEKYLQVRPKGFRAPQHSIDEQGIDVLREKDFEYDSSIIPWNFYHLLFFWKIKIKFKHNFSKMKIHKKNGIIEIPLTSLILPFSSIILRILPKPILRLYLKIISLYKNPLFFLHSWDLIEIPNSKIYKICNQKLFLERLNFMLASLTKNEKSARIKDLTHPI